MKQNDEKTTRDADKSTRVVHDSPLRSITKERDAVERVVSSSRDEI